MCVNIKRPKHFPLCSVTTPFQIVISTILKTFKQLSYYCFPKLNFMCLRNKRSLPILPIFIPDRARALRADWAPGPGVLVLDKDQQKAQN